ncbi:MAG TPA: indolepyruvate oxidoreductase subunit beta family protein [Burkholderiales bacterium]|nr:indolepyruvate oxidoreductase subunit beta family protein [Burkholderiales bacterium]
MSLGTRRPVTLLICALGGEGGGVLAEWLVDTARQCGYSAQSTSIPGVAQRTGSTTYYFEVFPVPIAELDGRKPVFSLYPVAGALDVLVSSELLETVRHISNGMASADRTLVITSNSRTLTTAEKIQLADGRAASAEMLKVVKRYSRDTRILDMTAVARETDTVLSAVLFGAIAGSDALPFPRIAFEQTIRNSGKGVDASLRGFTRACEIVARGEPEPITVVAKSRASGTLPAEVAAEFPVPVHEMLAAGYARMLDYQDHDYAQQYLRRLSRILGAERAADPAGLNKFATTSETARYLALWMAFDDIVRVADLKCRASRYERVRSEVKAAPGEVLRIYDHFKPGVPEFAALLPATLAAALVRWDRRRQLVGKSALALALKLPAHTLTGFLTLRMLAGLKWLRKRGNRFAIEQSMIERWLAAVEQGTRSHWQLGHEIAQCGRLVKGYGATNERGKENLLHVLDHLAVSATFPSATARTEAIRSARVAALADDAGKALDQALVKHGAPARPVRAQPVMWMKKRPDQAA